MANSSFRCSPDDQFELGYRQVWLGILREWEKLGPGVLKKEREKKTPRPQKPNAEKWYQLAVLAKKSGFGSETILLLLNQNPDQQREREFLLAERPPEDFEYHMMRWRSKISWLELRSC